MKGIDYLINLYEESARTSEPIFANWSYVRALKEIRKELEE